MMRMRIEIDDELLAEAMRITGVSKSATVEHGLREVVRVSKQRQALKGLRGIGWDGDLEEMRNGWSPGVDWGLERD
jgi:Arc/MetJ family transcription regulator